MTSETPVPQDEESWRDRVAMAAGGLVDLPADEAAEVLGERLQALLSPMAWTPTPGSDEVPDAPPGADVEIWSLYDPDTGVLHADVTVRLPPADPPATLV